MLSPEHQTLLNEHEALAERACMIETAREILRTRMLADAIRGIAPTAEDDAALKALNAKLRKLAGKKERLVAQIQSVRQVEAVIISDLRFRLSEAPIPEWAEPLLAMMPVRVESEK